LLYGEGGAEAHDSTSTYEVRKGEDDGEMLLPVNEYLETRDGEKPLGVFMIFDASETVQYISYSRNMVLSIKALLKRMGPQRVSFVKTMVFANKAMATRTNLEREVQSLVEECAAPPPGNGPERELWEGPPTSSAASTSLASLDLSVMSPAELAEYEEKKLRMRRAMGENLGDDPAAGSAEAEERRRKTLLAVEGDNWSAVVDEQTRATMSAAPSSGPSSLAPGAGSKEVKRETPFANASVSSTIDSIDFGDNVIEMTLAAVDKALDQVRPYLKADGGDVEVAAVTNGVVMLRLQGACGSCASSAATMKMGIERALHASFGDQVKEVIQLNTDEMPIATVTGVNAHLDPLRPSINSLGGKVEVVDVQQGTCIVKFKGPLTLGKGVVASIKDKFAPHIHEVILVGF